ncbi:Cof-type HAD-IIB family hydrolase [Paenibacillus silviterrae]|uniref:Cof-type HAD-IIB family hydrolase n=1 Tax=Paenibacillus silviterrae TaxID=3242194 RepID=UPI00254377F4|nr:Cof-type HAD-IIB family hydrolase [Paenibacillus chinjuensis]
MRYKLVALDMDGTVLNEHKQISEQNADAIRQAVDNGVVVMFSTGRGIQNITAYVEQLELQAPIVAVNGGEVWKAPGMLHSRKALQPDVVKSLYEKAVQEDAWYWAYTPDGLMTKDTWRELPWEEQQWLKFGFYSKEEQKLRGIQSWIEAMGELEVTNSHPTNLELNPKGVSKASGLSEVCALLGIQMSEVVAVGDSMNDYAMIRAAGLGVAMGNAQEELKRIASRVTSSNVEHGVAEVLHYVLACNKE